MEVWVEEEEAVSVHPDVARRRAKAAHANGLLSQEDVDALPDGTLVEIIWHGGNGPHRYEVHHRHGGSYALLPPGHPYYDSDQQDWSEGRGDHSRLIEHVGGTQRETWVRTPSAPETWPHRPLTWNGDGVTTCPACSGGECKFADHEHNRQFARQR